MKKFLAATFLLIILCAQVDAAKISSSDATFAVETINQRLREWNCTPTKIWFSEIPLDDAENVKYMNELADGRGFEKKFVACMVFYSDFRSPPDDGKVSAWNYDTDYKNYSWYFGFCDGTWHLMTFGY